MKLSTKGRYAITAIMAVALGEKSKPVTLAEISEEQGISVSYLEQIFARLRKNQLVKGTRGPGGGYCLARPPNLISISDVVTSVEDQVRIKRPLSGNQLDAQRNDAINQMWTDLSGRIQGFLSGITLADVIGNDASFDDDDANQDPASRLNVVENKHQWVA